LIIAGETVYPKSVGGVRIEENAERMITLLVSMTADIQPAAAPYAVKRLSEFIAGHRIASVQLGKRRRLPPPVNKAPPSAQAQPRG
jgi:hypothetical protein